MPINLFRCVKPGIRVKERGPAALAFLSQILERRVKPSKKKINTEDFNVVFLKVSAVGPQGATENAIGLIIIHII